MKRYAIVKRVVIYIIRGVLIGCFGFVMALFAGSVKYGGANAFVSAKTGVGLVQIAIFFIILSTSAYVAGLIYLVEDLSIGLKAVFQMTVIAVVSFMGRFFLGLIEKNGLLSSICSTLGMAVAGWLLCMAIYGIEVSKINRKIREIREKNRKDSNRES